MSYSELLARRKRRQERKGITVHDSAIHPSLKPFQREIVHRALEAGRHAIWADTGLGKTRMMIEWARPVWYNIHETNTLNARIAREDDDEKHLTPLQLDFIERCVRLWSNPGDTVFTAFGGVGSELYMAVKLGRRAIGIELKPSYWATGCRYLEELEHEMTAPSLFDEVQA